MPPTPDDDTTDPNETETQDPPVDDSTDDSGEEESSGINVTELATQIRNALKTDLESVVDSRVTKLMRTLKKDYGLERKKSASTDQDDEKERPSKDSGLSRVLRGAVRDEVTMRFDDAAERKTALSIAKKIADARGLADDEDEDDVATEIVDLVSSQMDGLREHYETAQRADLERRGLLKPDPAGQAQSTNGRKSAAKKSPVDAFKAGQALATEKFGSKVKQ